MIVAPLGSGSAGNAYYFESDGTSILVDSGFGPRETAKRLEQIGRELMHLRAIVLTHEHYDHIKGAESIARKLSIPIYMTRGTLDASTIDRNETPIVIFNNNSTFQIGELNVHACRTLHDAEDPACFVIESRDGTRVGIASDLGYVDDQVMRHLSGCDGLFFESNHDLDMLRMGTYPWSLKRRIMSRVGHLSNDDSMHAVQRMIGADLKTLCMIHLSQKNNHESIMRDMAAGLLARTGVQLELGIAKQFEATG
ncbi:MAG TPA: MBL fold metallo-hydrolase, partial [Thermoanaerobaculia bacterium]